MAWPSGIVCVICWSRGRCAVGLVRDPNAPTAGREVLALMAAGLTDRGISTRLSVSTRTAQAHAEAIRKLDLPASPDDNRRVHAVLTYLKA
jgi:DNA-binding NarL/FixJ family response regulator